MELDGVQKCLNLPQISWNKDVSNLVNSQLLSWIYEYFPVFINSERGMQLGKFSKCK